MDRNVTYLDYLLARIMPIGNVLVMKRAVRNWHDLLLFVLGVKKHVVLVLNSGKKYALDSSADYYNFIWMTADWAVELAKQMNPDIKISGETIRVRFRGKKVLLYFDSPATMGNTARLAIQQLVEGEYSWLKSANRDVVDIGATVADSSIYFAIDGARHVYALEPAQYSYRIAKKNVRLNRLEKKITLLNEAVSGKPAVLRVKKSRFVRMDNTLEEEMSSSGKEIRVVTLEDIVGRYKINDGILKIDCEGCEYSSLLNTSNEVLRRFKRIMIEYHFGYRDLESKLRAAGFTVRHTVPKYGGYHDPHHPTLYGLIFAERR